MRQLLSLANTQSYCMALHLQQHLRHGRNIASADRSLMCLIDKQLIKEEMAGVKSSNVTG